MPGASVFCDYKRGIAQVFLESVAEAYLTATTVTRDAGGFEGPIDWKGHGGDAVAVAENSEHVLCEVLPGGPEGLLAFARPTLNEVVEG
jgi:hypothetical protein